MNNCNIHLEPKINNKWIMKIFHPLTATFCLVFFEFTNNIDCPIVVVKDTKIRKNKG
jgi:hypothetical protein